MDADLYEYRRDFNDFMAEKTEQILSRAQELGQAFERYASQFLAEHSSLTWAPVESRVGQMGATVKYPNFAVTLGGSDFGVTTERNAEDEVSESQKEFIDLAFRMALLEVASGSPRGSLIVDSPDYSLESHSTTTSTEMFGTRSSAARDWMAQSDDGPGELGPRSAACRSCVQGEPWTRQYDRGPHSRIPRGGSRARVGP